MSPLTGAGAWLWASGSHECMGARPALVAKPRTASAPAARAREGSRLGALPSSATHDSVDSPPACPAADSRPIPRNAIATPTAPRTTYFQAASRESRSPRDATRNAVVMVVSSIATHIRPTLSAKTARVMAARNRQSRVANEPIRGFSWLRLGMPPQSETPATTPTTVSIQALSESTHSSPPAVVRGSWEPTKTTSTTPAPSRTPEARTGSHSVHQRRRSTKLRPARATGSSSGIQINTAISRAAPSIR